MYGRDSTILGEWEAPEPDVATDMERVLSRAEALVQLTQVTLPQARANVGRAQAAQRRAQDRRYVIVPPLEPGTQVFVEVGYFGQPLREKLADRYSGPYRVVKRLDNGNYVLRTREGQELPRSVPRDKMKRGRLGTELSAEELRGAELRSSQVEVERAPAGAGAAQPVAASPVADDDLWEWERVLAARRRQSGEWEYYVQWANMAPDAPDRCQWIRESDFTDPSTVRGYRRLGDLHDEASADGQLQARRAPTSSRQH
jgi:hypothetical protein